MPRKTAANMPGYGTLPAGSLIYDPTSTDLTISNGSTIQSTSQFPVVDNASQNTYIQSANKTTDTLSFMLANLYTHTASGAPFPPIPTGRTITFNNNTSATTIDIYMTKGAPGALPAAIIAGGNALAPTGIAIWNIPTDPSWNGNFMAVPTGTPPISGATLAEFGLNQLWSGSVPPLRDTFDISTVPPGLGNQGANGPHSTCVQISSKYIPAFTTQQTYGYNIGIEIIPPSGSLPSQTVTCNQANGDSPNSVGYPNDTAYPKQQTIECTGNYIINFIDPVPV
jgi:hypothetical protein